ncbi:ThiF family adenylyltransferase [Mycolicibacterium vanbaalenii PYR-1]|nr:ThiF family adenylyltransferase [Mycolicibacterium vanbaalenii]MCV7126974.1 ThiF family adenylyltransferase [Mycolicibacterium vanbaalenii PYR-1]
MRKQAHTAKAAEAVAGTPWSITDMVLDIIDRELAVPAPERGAALIAVRDSRLIVDVVSDPRPGESVSYWHSDQLRRRLSDYLTDNPTRRYVGTVHSHPGGYAEPSGPDHQAFANMLATNRAIRDAIFPIVVQAPRDGLGSVLRLGDKHLADLPHGTFAGYSAHPTDAGLVVRPAPIHVVPAGAHAAVVADALTRHLGQPVTVRWGEPLTVSGTAWLTAQFMIDTRTIAGVALGPSYPMTPPMVWAAESASPVFSSWPISATGDHLAGAVSAVLQHQTPPVAAVRAGIRERLSVHLPNQIDAHVLLIGAGSVGSNAAEMLIRSGVKRLTVVDFDTVEPANLSRTVYGSGDLGQLKTAALADRLTAIAADVEITQLTCPLQELTGEVLDTVDLAFLASDDMAGEGWLNHELYVRAIPSVSVKVFAGAEGAELAYVLPARNTACLRCMMGAVGSGDRGDADYGTGRINGSPALGPDIAAAAARGVKVALALTQTDGPLADWLDELVSRRLTYFLSSNVAGWTYTEFARAGSLPFDGLWLTAPGRPECEICGMERVSDTQPAHVAAFTTSPPQGIGDVDTDDHRHGEDN